MADYPFWPARSPSVVFPPRGGEVGRLLPRGMRPFFFLVFRCVCHQSFPSRSGNVRRQCYNVLACAIEWPDPSRFRERCKRKMRYPYVFYVWVVARSVFVLRRELWGGSTAIFWVAADVCCAPAAAMRVCPQTLGEQVTYRLCVVWHLVPSWGNRRALRVAKSNGER